MNQSYDQLLDSLKALALYTQELDRKAAQALAPVVERLIATRSRDVASIEQTLDRLLDCASHPEALALFKSLCRHYYRFAPQAAAEYVLIYRKQWASDETEEDAGARR